MTQDQVMLLLLKAGIVAGIASVLTWIIVYGRLQPWWRDQIGLSLVTMKVIVTGQLCFLGLAVFLHLSRLDNRLIGWAYTVFTLAITPVMVWRTVVWIRASREPPEGPEE